MGGLDQATPFSYWGLESCLLMERGLGATPGRETSQGVCGRPDRPLMGGKQDGGGPAEIWAW